MADVYTAPSTEVSLTTLPAADWNTYVRDNQTALQLGLHGDGSTDSDAVHRHKSGAAGSAPPTAGNPGRIYGPDGQILIENTAGTAHYTIGPGPYDDFIDSRVSTSTITPAISGHPWVEENSINWEITAAGLLKPVSTGGIATLNTRTLLDRKYTVGACFTLGTGTNDIGIVMKYVDSSNYTYASIQEATFQIVSVIGGATNVRAIASHVATDTFSYILEVTCLHQFVRASVFFSPGVGQSDLIVRHADFAHANLAAATKIGIRGANNVAGCQAIWSNF